MKKYLTWGAGPRACQALLLGGKAHALLDGRVHVSTDDIRYVARPVLRHRLATSFRAESDGVTADHIVEKLFHEVREPVGEIRIAPRRTQRRERDRMALLILT